MEIVKNWFIDASGWPVWDDDCDNLDLSARAKNGLRRRNIQKVSDLDRLDRETLSRTRNLGEKSVDEILAVCRQYTETHRGDFPGFPELYDAAEQIAAAWSLPLRYLMEHLFDANLNHIPAEEALWQLCTTEQAVAEAGKFDVLRNFCSIELELPRSQLLESIPECLSFRHKLLEKYLEELEQENKVLCHGDIVTVIRPTVLEYIQSIEVSERNRGILLRRVQGVKMTDIGEEYAMTRSNVSSICKRTFLRKRTLLKEDLYSTFFFKYNVSESMFFTLFQDEKAETYHYLQAIDPETIPDKRNLIEALNDPDIPEAIKKQIRRKESLFTKCFSLNGVQIPQNRGGLVRYIAEQYCKDLTPETVFREKYQEVLMALGLEDDEKYILSERYFNNISRQDFVLLGSQRTSIRFYDIAEKDFTELYATLNLKQYKDIELSTLKLFRDYPELMAKYDIRNEFELHNLLRKTLPAELTGVNLSRMPTLRFGNARRKDQILKLLEQVSPVTQTDFISLYEEAYGIRLYGYNLKDELQEVDHLFVKKETEPNQGVPKKRFDVSRINPDRLKDESFAQLIELVDAELKEQNWSIPDFARVLDVTVEPLRNFLYGKTIRGSSVILPCATYFGVPLEPFLPKKKDTTEKRRLVRACEYLEISPELGLLIKNLTDEQKKNLLEQLRTAGDDNYGM